MAKRAKLRASGRSTRRPKAPRGGRRSVRAAAYAVLDDVPAIIWHSGRDAKCDYFNTAWLEFTGRRLEQELGDGWAEGVHPDDRDRCVRKYLAAFRKRRPFELTYRLRHRDGSYRWILDVGRPTFDSRNRFSGYLGGCFDQSEQLRAIVAARENEARLASFLHHSPSVMFVKDLEGRYLVVNGEFLKQFGLKLRQVIGKTDREIFGTRQAVAFNANDQRVIESGMAIEIEEIAQYIDGPHVSIVSKFPIPDAKGCVAAIGGMATDITDRKRVEQALRYSERQLRNAIEERERLFRDLHDGIVQEIYSIGMGLEEIQRQVAGDAQPARDGLSAAIARLNGVIRDVRRHITKGAEPKALHGGQLVAALQRFAQTPDGSRQPAFHMDVDPEAISRLSATAAEHSLNIIREAMSNVLRHSNGSSGWVSIRSLHGAVQIVVEDNGKGFDPSTASPKRRGLRNIAARARELGAQLAVQAKPGSGTRVVVDVPVEPTDGAS